MTLDNILELGEKETFEIVETLNEMGIESFDQNFEINGVMQDKVGNVLGCILDIKIVMIFNTKETLRLKRYLIEDYIEIKEYEYTVLYGEKLHMESRPFDNLKEILKYMKFV